MSVDLAKLKMLIAMRDNAGSGKARVDATIALFRELVPAAPDLIAIYEAAIQVVNYDRKIMSDPDEASRLMFALGDAVDAARRLPS